MKAPLDVVIDTLCEVGRPAMLGVWGADSCIAATAIAIEALRAYEYDAGPLAVDVRTHNRVAAEALMAGASVADVRADPEAWGVGLGVATSPVTGPNGMTRGGEVHLVAWLPPLIIDLSLDQASRPEHDLTLRPGALAVPPDLVDRFIVGESVSWRLPAGGLISYRVRPGVTWWRDSPNWRRRDAAKRARVVGAVIRAIRAKEGV